MSMASDDRRDPLVADRARDAMSPLDLGGRAIAARGDAGVRAAPGAPPVAVHWLHTTLGRWSLRIAAAAAFLALGAWYGTRAAQRVATDLTPGAGRLAVLADPVFADPGGVASNVGAAAVRHATDAYVAELMRLEREKERLTPAQRTAAEAAARARLTKALEDLTLKHPEQR